MKLFLKHSDITTENADALIYSTNVQLMLSGGVGACLLEKFGTKFQDVLLKCVDSTERQLADVGEVFMTPLDFCPWKVVFHTVATDPLYNTNPKVVHSIIAQCLSECINLGEVKTIVTSPLGAGYGDLPFSKFLDIVSDFSFLPEMHLIESFTVCCDDADFAEELKEYAQTLKVKWHIE